MNTNQHEIETADLYGFLARNECDVHRRNKGFFVSFDYSQEALSEIQAFFKKTGKSIIALMVKDILDE